MAERHISVLKTKAGNGMVHRRNYGIVIKKARPFIKGIIAGVTVTVICAVIGALIFNIADAPEGADSVMGYVTLGASAVMCGMFFGGGRRKNGFAWGTLGGISMFVLCLIITLITGGFSGMELVPKFIASAVCGCVGGIIGVNLAAEH